MISPTHPAAAQQVAQLETRPRLGFATGRRFGDADGMAVPKTSSALLRLYCNPSFSLWPGPPWVGPAFAATRQDCAGTVAAQKFRFPSKANALASVAIKTPNRGRKPCARPSFFSLFLHCRLPAACKTPLRAVWPGRRVARLSLMPSMATQSPARLSAGWRGSPPAASTWACPPATDQSTAQTCIPLQGPAGHMPRLALSHFRKAS